MRIKTAIYHLTSTVCQKGFTFIELIVVFSVIGILSTVGIASFVNYSRTQQLNSAASELMAVINLARSRAMSQVKPTAVCGDQTMLESYEVKICGLPTSASCIDSYPNGIYGYELITRCSGDNHLILGKKLQNPITFVSDVNATPTTTTTSVIFPILSGGVKGTGQIVLKEYNQTKTLTIGSLEPVRKPTSTPIPLPPTLAPLPTATPTPAPTKFILKFSNAFYSGTRGWEAIIYDLKSGYTYDSRPAGLDEPAVLTLSGNYFVLTIIESGGSAGGLVSFSLVSVPSLTGVYTWDSKNATISGGGSAIAISDNDSLITGTLLGSIYPRNWGSDEGSGQIWSGDLNIQSATDVSGKVNVAQHIVGSTISVAGVPIVYLWGSRYPSSALEYGRLLIAHIALTINFDGRFYNYMWLFSSTPRYATDSNGSPIPADFWFKATVTNEASNRDSWWMIPTTFKFTGSIYPFVVVVASQNAFGGDPRVIYSYVISSGTNSHTEVIHNKEYWSLYASPDLNASWDNKTWRYNNWYWPIP